MSSGFTSTYILEANRLSSEEVKSGNNSNNALFTNKVNNGLRLNTGDIVSVNSAYISELGAEGSQIEIKGKLIDKLNASVVLQYNEVTHSQGRELGVEEFVGEDEYLINTTLVNNFYLNRRVSASQVIQFRDDEINIVMNPYKNTNGEFYMSLPYNYITPDADLSVTNYEGFDGSADGYPIIQEDLSEVGHDTCGNITRLPDSRSWNTEDRKQYRAHVNAPLNNCVANDNSRYSIFQMREVIHTYPMSGADFTTAQNVGLAGIPYDNASTTASLTNGSYVLGDRADHKSNHLYRDIATFPYERVRNLVNASVNVGYNSTNDVASKLTEDFLRTENIERRVYNGVEITTIAENQVNKLYKCASPENFQYKNAGSFLNWVDGTNASNIYNYISAYETIGVKRPDLYELGREALPVEGYTIATDFISRRIHNQDQIVETTIPWTEDNLINISKLLEAQQRYPELLDVRNLAGDTSNFLDAEVMSIDNNIFFLHVNMNASNDGVLGYDLQDVQSSYFTSRTTTASPPSSFATMPMFFNFNPLTRDKSASDVSGSDYDNAVYGFAIKRTNASNESFINLLTYNHYDYGTNNASGYDIYPAGVRIGWDWHFTAYGCPCILLYNGFLGKQGIAYQGMGLAKYVNTNELNTPERNLPEAIPEVYLGSPDVSIAFSDETDRFEIRHLHQAEVIGNLYNAGYTAEKTYQVINASTGAVEFTNPDIAVPVNPQADQKCYKVNKQPNKNNFTPAMAPYFSQRNASFFTSYTDTNNGSKTAQQPFPFVNPNYIVNTIYDSMCGNYIVDWGMNEKYWDQSLWGIMGFKYHQTTGNGNNQTRITNSVNWSNMDENTTNADITNADFDEMTRNMFNTPTFNITPVNAIRPRFQTPSGNASHSFYPDVVITQTNGQPLRAENIPTRTLRPYYTIRSNIIGQAQYLGGGDSGIPLPVVAVVDKVSNSGDFFNIDSSGLQFTITQPTIITDITTSIHDPDGSFSSLSPNSAVLYKIQKTVNADMNVVSTILKEEPKKQALEFEESLENPQPTKKDVKDVVNMMVVKPQK
jgi:hypothetical protein